MSISMSIFAKNDIKIDISNVNFSVNFWWKLTSKKKIDWKIDQNCQFSGKNDHFGQFFSRFSCQYLHSTMSIFGSIFLKIDMKIDNGKVWGGDEFYLRWCKSQEIVGKVVKVFWMWKSQEHDHMSFSVTYDVCKESTQRQRWWKWRQKSDQLQGLPRSHHKQRSGIVTLGRWQQRTCVKTCLWVCLGHVMVLKGE